MTVSGGVDWDVVPTGSKSWSWKRSGDNCNGSSVFSVLEQLRRERAARG